MNDVSEFEKLTPDLILGAAEAALGAPFTGFTAPLPSYINRVYELQARDGTRYIAKFYRPGRWSLDAIRQEHEFIRDCRADEIPVIAPLDLLNGETLGETGGIPFCIFPKRLGREFEPVNDEDWLRVGRLLGRLHTTGAGRPAPARVTLHPQTSTAQDIRELVEGRFIPPRQLDEFKAVTADILTVIIPPFDGLDFIRTHGDCHRGNIIHRPEEGIFLIDFDDMMTAPPVQDIWMLLPGSAEECRREVNLIIEGYEDFRDFPWPTLRLVEALRVMRMIYFLAWCSRQVNDFRFKQTFPDWGSFGFWEREIHELRHQAQVIRETLKQHPFGRGF